MPVYHMQTGDTVTTDVHVISIAQKQLSTPSGTLDALVRLSHLLFPTSSTHTSCHDRSCTLMLRHECKNTRTHSLLEHSFFYICCGKDTGIFNKFVEHICFHHFCTTKTLAKSRLSGRPTQCFGRSTAPLALFPLAVG